MNRTLTQHTDLATYGPELADTDLAELDGGHRVVIVIRDGDRIIIIVVK